MIGPWVLLIEVNRSLSARAGPEATGRFANEEAAICCRRIVEVLNNPKSRGPVAEVIRIAGIREMPFPDTWVIIPCSVWLKKWRFIVTNSRGFSILET